MVGTTGIEPVTPAMSRQCSTAELRAHKTKPGLHSPGARKIPHAGCVTQQRDSYIFVIKYFPINHAWLKSDIICSAGFSNEKLKNIQKKFRFRHHLCKVIMERENRPP